MKKTITLLALILLCQQGRAQLAIEWQRQFGGSKQELPSIIWQKMLGGTNFEHLIDMVQTTDGGFVTVGVSNSTDGDVTVPIHPPLEPDDWYDFWVIKLNLLTGTEDIQNGQLQVYPNPFSESFSIMPDIELPVSQISLFNTLGQNVLQIDGQETEAIDGSLLPDGWYLLRALTENGKTIQAKVLKARAGN